MHVNEGKHPHDYLDEMEWFEDTHVNTTKGNEKVVQEDVDDDVGYQGDTSSVHVINLEDDVGNGVGDNVPDLEQDIEEEVNEDKDEMVDREKGKQLDDVQNEIVDEEENVEEVFEVTFTRTVRNGLTLMAIQFLHSKTSKDW